MTVKRLLLAAGGTGGHMFPAQALAEEMRDQGWETALITDQRGEKLAGAFPVQKKLTIDAASINPRRPLAAAKGVFTIFKGVSQSKRFIKEWQPDAIAGFGGYPAFPAVKAAQSLGVPSLLHEQNAVLGRVNRALAKKANILATGFEHVAGNHYAEKTVFTGNPVRQQILDNVPKQYRRKKTQRIFIIGGSLGAKLISETVPLAIASLPKELRARIKIVQQTREEHMEFAQETYKKAGITAHCQSFFHDIETELAKADYIISRAGALSVSEIALMGKPCLFVPLAIAMDDHQTANAQSLKSLNAADILPEEAFTPENVSDVLQRRLNDPDWLKSAAKSAKSAAKPNAAAELAELISRLT